MRGLRSLSSGRSVRSGGAWWGLLVAGLLVAGVSGCGEQCLTCDRCERLCGDVGDAVQSCMPEELGWSDLGATDRADFVRLCRADWEDTRADLTSRELELAIDVCEQARDDVDALTCDEIVGLYGL